MMRQTAMAWLAMVTTLWCCGCDSGTPPAPPANTEIQLPKNQKQKGNQSISVDTFPLPKEVLVAPKKK